MATRRMFSLDVVGTDRFLDMPLTTQALYFHLGMHADDDGFVSSPKTISRTVGCSSDDIKILISKKYIIPLENGIIVISDWRVNNWIRADRKRDTHFKNLKERLVLSNGVYILPEDSREAIGELLSGCQPTANQSPTNCHTQYSIGKDSIDKDNINIITPETDKSAPEGTGILIPLQDKTSYDVPADKIPMWKQAYPAVDIKQELWKIVSWCDANPKKRKTRRGVERFITGWLERAQNRGGYYRPAESPERPNSLPYRKSDVITIEPGPKLTQEELDAMEPLVIPDNL